VAREITPGWYPDPQTAGQLRYWDGRAWTEHVQPAGTDPPAPAPPAAAGAEPAGERSDQLRRDGPFTTAASVGDFLLLRDTGFEPLGVVTGNAVQTIALPPLLRHANEELGPLSKAMRDGRELALDRLRDEAEALGADGVVGMRLDVKRYEWGPEMAEFAATGTAVRAAGAGQPFVTDLAGEELAALVSGGYRPVGVALGVCVYHVAFRALDQSFGRPPPVNQELPDYSRALGEARERALGRMQWDAEQLGAGGVVGVRVEHRGHGWSSHVSECLAVGTALAPDTRAA
jgi:uncharacterized protein YbjQ (UPF0145 family)